MLCKSVQFLRLVKIRLQPSGALFFFFFFSLFSLENLWLENSVQIVQLATMAIVSRKSLSMDIFWQLFNKRKRKGTIAFDVSFVDRLPFSVNEEWLYCYYFFFLLRTMNG